MNPPTRPPNGSDGSTAVTATEESGGDPPRVGATGASAQTSRSKNNNSSSSDTGSSGGGGEPLSPARCRSSSSVDSLGVFQKRSIFTSPRRRSSGYFSFDSDSLPSPPLSPRPVTADRATQTPSPSCQAMKHALRRMGKARRRGPGTQHLSGNPRSPSSMLQREEMQEEAIGQELRRIGDDYNRILQRRGAAGVRRHVVIHPNQLPQVQQEPALLLCMGLLLFVIGRLIYSQV